MIDLKAIEDEVQQARLARIEAETATQDVEDLIWQVQHVQLGRQRIVFSIEGLDPDGFN
jgi:hypothetical protein